MRAEEGQATRATESPEAARSAFGETANPAEYVPREASEDALRELERLVRRGRTAALTSPPGLGKSLLLHVLGRRLGDGFPCLFLPYAAVTLPELCAWSLGLLGRLALEDPAAVLVAEVRERAQRRESLVLLIDDAGSMPLQTARGLAALVRESGSRLRVVLGTADDAASSRVLAALHPEVREVRFTQPMTARETRAYVQTRLEQSGARAELRVRFDEDAIGWIHRLSGGVPRQVHDLACTLLDQPPDGVGRVWADERWLGAPLGSAEESGALDAWPDEDAPEQADAVAPEDDCETPEVLTDADDPELPSSG